jgi:hypothetical protein
MDPTEIQDRQFGRLRSEDGWLWFSKEVEWKPEQMIQLSIHTQLTEGKTIPEHARNVFNALRERENEYMGLAAQNVLDGLNETMVDCEEGRGIKTWPIDAHEFANHVSLWFVEIDPDEDSELQYVTGGPVVRVFVSSDLTFKEAFLDCPGCG